MKNKQEKPAAEAVHARAKRPTALSAWLCAGLLACGAAGAAQESDATALSLEQLLQVNVVGASKYEQKQSEVAAAVSVITRREIKDHGWRTLGQALASLPGVYATYDRQYEYIGTRGFSLLGDFNTRVLLTIDGNRVNDAVFDQAYVGRDFPLDLDLIDRIEFIAGPGGAVYGQNAMFAVINVVTRKGAGLDGVQLAASGELPQSARQGRASWGRRLDNGVDLLLSVSGLRSRGRDLALDFGAADVSGVAVGLDGERSKQFFASAERGPWAFEFAYGDRRKDDAIGTYQSEPLTAGQYQRDRLMLSQLRYHMAWPGDAWQLAARVFVGGERYTGPFIYGGDATLETGSSDWRGVELQLLSTAWNGHKLMAGIEYQASTRLDQSFVDVGAPANTVDLPGAGWRAGVYAQDEWSVAPGLAATLGLRHDSTRAGRNALSPRVGLTWQVGAETSLKALAGRAYRAPNVFESNFSYVDQTSNPALRGESIDTLELVADRRVGKDLALRASAYRWSLRDLITLGIDPVSGLSQYQNGTRATAQGLELSARQGWRSGASLRASLSYQHAHNVDGTPSVNSPRWLARLDLAGPLPGSELRAAWELQCDGSRLTDDGTAVAGYCLSSVQLLTDHWLQGVEVSLGIHNLGGVRYAQPGSRNNWQNTIAQDGRSLRLKFEYRY
ncbi:MAG: TonB-dependent receptor [Burkholderiales bacterium]|nr:TonB-dependent receptor [Burkholderiales bacterium]